MVKFFFVEGPDGSGKTTVLNNLINLDRMSKIRISETVSDIKGEKYDINYHKIYIHAVLSASKFATQTRRTLMDMADNLEEEDQYSLLDLGLVSLVNVLRTCKKLAEREGYEGIVLDRGLLSAWIYREGISFEYFLDRLKAFALWDDKTLHDMCQEGYHLICKPEKLVAKAINAYDAKDQSEISKRYDLFLESHAFNTIIIDNEPILNKVEGQTDFPDPVHLGVLIYSNL